MKICKTSLFYDLLTNTRVSKDQQSLTDRNYSVLQDWGLLIRWRESDSVCPSVSNIA